MSQTTAASRPFSARANDIRCRDLSARLSRYFRARLQWLCAAGLLVADDPRVLTAWRKGWDASHYLRLQRWRDEGFRPRTVYDVGAHLGFWSEMAQSVLAPRELLLFEPQRQFQEEAIRRRPAAASWRMMPVALGNREAVQAMHVTENSAASSLLPPEGADVPESWGTKPVGQEEVRVVPLDRLVETESLPRPQLVKIDVQGYEAPLLAGGRETLSSAERIVIEVSLQPIYQGQALLPQVAQTLSEWGFVLEDISEGCRPWPGPVSQVDLWMKRA